jgi:hypothetical protein
VEFIYVSLCMYCLFYNVMLKMITLSVSLSLSLSLSLHRTSLISFRLILSRCMGAFEPIIYMKYVGNNPIPSRIRIVILIRVK